MRRDIVADGGAAGTGLPRYAGFRASGKDAASRNRRTAGAAQQEIQKPSLAGRSKLVA